MKYLITESKLEDVSYRFVLDTLDGMDFRFKKYKEFDFFPKGTHDFDNGIEADYAVGEGYHVLIGNSLFRSVKDLFGLTADQTETAFRRALNDKGIKKIALLHSLDFSEYRDIFPRNESVIKESKLEKSITNYLDEIFNTENINMTYFEVYDEETGEEENNEYGLEFYIGDYGDNQLCFYWYGCDYFDINNPESETCPIVTVAVSYERQLNGYFGNMWKEPFKTWFTHNFDKPVKTVE